MKKKSNFPIILILVIGLSLLIYPSFANWFNNRHYDAEITKYIDTFTKSDGSEAEALLKKAEEYNKRLKEQQFSLKLSNEMFNEYINQLKIEGSQVMATINIPSLGVNLPIYHTTEEKVLDVGVGHIEGSSLPVGGEGTHCALSGHRGLPSSKLFTDLDRVQEGDYFIINTLGRELYYEVDQISIVLPEDVGDLKIEEDKDYCTLVTCTPYGINTHRLLVRGHRIDEISNLYVSNEAVKVDKKIITLFILTAACVFISIYKLVKK